MVYVPPNQEGSKVKFKSRYGNFIGGEWKEPVKGQYFENITPVTGQAFCEIPRSTSEDIEKALDAAHGAKASWGKTSTTERANMLNKIADRIEQNLEALAIAETWDNGKPVRETLAADHAAHGRSLPLLRRRDSRATRSCSSRDRRQHRRVPLS